MLAIPDEIKKAIRQKKVRRIVIFIITVLLMAVVIIMFEKSASSFSENLTAFKSVLYPVLLISSVFISKVYRIFTDTDYCGVVKNVKVKTVTDNKSAAKPTREQMYRKNIIYLTIEDEAGKTFRKKAAETPITPKSDSEAYKVGDTVLHLHGTGIAVVLPTAADTRCHCAVCGGSNDKMSDICEHCGLPLIKSIGGLQK